MLFHEWAHTLAGENYQVLAGLEMDGRKIEIDVQRAEKRNTVML